MLSTSVFSQKSGCKTVEDKRSLSYLTGFMRFNPLLLNPQRKEGVEKRRINVIIVIDCQCHDVN